MYFTPRKDILTNIQDKAVFWVPHTLVWLKSLWSYWTSLEVRGLGTPRAMTSLISRFSFLCSFDLFQIYNHILHTWAHFTDKMDICNINTTTLRSKGNKYATFLSNAQLQQQLSQTSDAWLEKAGRSLQSGPTSRGIHKNWMHHIPAVLCSSSHSALTYM